MAAISGTRRTSKPGGPGANITATPLAVIAPDSYFLLIFQLAGHDSHLSFLRHALFGGWSEISIPGPYRPLCQTRSQLASGPRSRARAGGRAGHTVGRAAAESSAQSG